MGNTVPIHKKSSEGAITIPELIKLSQSVGKNTSDIEQLKKQTEELGGLKVEIILIKTSQNTIAERLNTLSANDKRIEKSLDAINAGTIRFRYWLWIAVVAIFVCIFGTLQFGITITEKNQNIHNANLQKQISDGNARNSDNFKAVSEQLKELTRRISK